MSGRPPISANSLFAPNRRDAPAAGTIAIHSMTGAGYDRHMSLIDPGKNAPAFSLKDQDGQTHRLSDYAGKFVVLYFYPKDDTPGCTTESCSFRDNLPKFKASKAVILGASILDEKSKAKFASKYNLTFPLLAD